MYVRCHHLHARSFQLCNFRLRWIGTCFCQHVPALSKSSLMRTSVFSKTSQEKACVRLFALVSACLLSPGTVEVPPIGSPIVPWQQSEIQRSLDSLINVIQFKFNQPKLCMAPQISRFRRDLQLVCTVSHRPSLDVKMMAGNAHSTCTGPGVTKLFQLRMWSWYHLQHSR